MAAIMGGTSLVSTGIKADQARRQRKEGRELESSLVRPDYKIPNSIKKNYKLAEIMANQGISSEEENAFMDDLSTSSANSITNFRNRKSGTVGAEVIGDQMNKAMRDFRVADARQKIENQKAYMTQGQIFADYQDKQFQLNELDPYADNMNYARSLQGAGMQNMNSAIDGFINSISSAGNGYMQGLISE